MAERTLTTLIVVLAVADLGLGVWMAVWPGSFFRTIGGFGVRTDHYIRDSATWSLALGLALLASVRRRSWRVPLLFLAALQAVLHVANHIADVGNSAPAWVGPVDVVLLAGQGVAFAMALGAATRSRARRQAVERSDAGR
jgi:peptidoglycan/LPS O-acetylase OafA/YrhL